MSAVAYRAAILTPLARGGVAFFADAHLVVRGSRIESVGGPRPEGTLTHDLRGHLIIPGLVDAHVHYPQTRVVGSASGPLLPWLEHTVFPEEARFAEESYATTVAMEFCRAVVARGTTTVGAYASSSLVGARALFEALDASGLRAVAGPVLMDQNCPAELRVAEEPAIAALDALLAEVHRPQGRLSLAVIPRFAISCSMKLLRRAAEFAERHDLAVMTHVAENHDEGRETLRLHSVAEDYLGVYEHAGLVGPRTLLAHAIHLSASEWDRVAERGAKIAHCPDSNFFLGSGSMPLGEVDRRDVTVGLGTDVAAGRSFDLRRTVGHAHDAALITGASAPPERLFRMATLGGAQALGLGDVTGSLEPGKAADFAVLRLPPHEPSEQDALRYATFAADLAPVVRVAVDGRRVFNQGAPA